MMIKVVQCPKCGWIQLSTADKGFKCRKCNATRMLRKVKIIKVVNDHYIARKLVIALRKNH